MSTHYQQPSTSGRVVLAGHNDDFVSRLCVLRITRGVAKWEKQPGICIASIVFRFPYLATGCTLPAAYLHNANSRVLSGTVCGGSTMMTFRCTSTSWTSVPTILTPFRTRLTGLVLLRRRTTLRGHRRSMSSCWATVVSWYRRQTTGRFA